MRKFNILSAILFLMSVNVWGGEKVQGTVEWVDRIELGTPLSGVIDKVSVQPGQTVKQGDLLVQLDRRSLLVKRDAAKASVSMHEAERKESARERDRSVELYDQTLLSDHDLNVAKIDYSKAEADYQNARATLADVQLQLEYAQIRAPYDATVLSVPAYKGQAVANRTVITTLAIIARKDAYQVNVYLDEAQLAAIQPDTNLTVTINGQSVVGTVSAAFDNPMQSDAGARFPIRILLKELPDTTIRAGQSATVELP